ncbi:MAG: hypothetical protein GYA02_15690 [Clostridiaceae bacterium]|nr:hypothetical protein [Clostridiaceae bacterium]
MDEKKITFDIIPYYDNSAVEFNYFGNNSAANIQYYAVRDVNSISNFWVGKRSGILKNILDSLPKGELYALLKECYDAGFFNNNGINTEFFVFHDGTSGIKIDCIVKKNKKIFIIGNEEYSAENLLKHIRGLSNKCRVILVIPRIIKNKQKTVISTNKDYIDLVMQSIEGANCDELSEGVCHICQGMKKDINTIAYSSKLSRSSINKIFVTTTINYAPAFNKNNYNSNYAICQRCYLNLITGEKTIVKRFGNAKIAGEKVILLFEGIDKKIDYTYIDEMKAGIDLVFNPKNTEDWYNKLIIELNKEQILFLFQFSMVFYKSDGNSCEIKSTITDVTYFRLVYIANTFENVRMKLGKRLKYFNLGHVYRIIPVSTDKDGKQLDIKRVLSLYHAMLKGETINKNYIFELAADALEKGLRQLNSSKIRNFTNLNLSFYKEYEAYGKDRYIEKIIMSYIGFVHVLQRLDIISEEVFSMTEITENEIQDTEKDAIRRREAFLANQGFSEIAKGLFYLGCLMYEVGKAQYKQDHKEKPILNKVQYQGMNTNDVLDLYLSILEKLRQYSKYIYLHLCEKFLKQLHSYLGIIENCNFLSDKENVFYIMSGYAFSVGDYQKRKTDESNNQNNDVVEVDDNDN